MDTSASIPADKASHKMIEADYEELIEQEKTADGNESNTDTETISAHTHYEDSFTEPDEEL